MSNDFGKNRFLAVRCAKTAYLSAERVHVQSLVVVLLYFHVECRARDTAMEFRSLSARIFDFFAGGRRGEAA